jgi:membrane protein YqaA with SNARE-associated domain
MHWFRHIAHILYLTGGLGLLTVSFLDSSFLVLPLGNDVFMVALSAHHRTHIPYYIVLATLGSVLGCWLMEEIGRKGFSKKISKKRLQFVQTQVEKYGVWALSFASLMPPPFPFTTFVTAAAALKYPPKKLLGIIAVARCVRFSIEGLLAFLYGRWLLSLMRSDNVRYVILFVAVLTLAGCGYSIYTWAQKGGSRTVRPRAAVG